MDVDQKIGESGYWITRDDYEAYYSVKTKDNFPIATGNEGFALTTLYELGLLDMSVKDPLCPGGCYPWGEYLYSVAIQERVSGFATGVWPASSFKYNRVPSFKSMRRCGMAYENKYIMRALSQTAIEIHQQRAINPVPIFIPIDLRLDPGDGHMNLIIMKLYFEGKDIRLDLDIYDPWGAGENAYRNEELPPDTIEVAVTMMFRDSLTKTGYNFLGATQRKVLSSYTGIQSTIYDERRDAARKALEKIASQLHFKEEDGFCVTFCIMMMILRMMHPTVYSEEIEEDFATVFYKLQPEEGSWRSRMSFLQNLTWGLSPLFSTLSRGADALARVFSLNLADLARHIAKRDGVEIGKGGICCPKEEQPSQFQ